MEQLAHTAIIAGILVTLGFSPEAVAKVLATIYIIQGIVTISVAAYIIYRFIKR